MHALRVIESLEMQVELPMLMEVENCGTMDSAKNWIVGVRTCNIEAR